MSDERHDSTSRGQPDMPPLQQPYMLLTQIPYYVDSDGSVWLQELWHRDFVAHLRYLRRPTLAAPAYPKGDQDNLVKIDVPPGVTLSYVALPPFESTLSALRYLPKTCAVLAHAIGKAEIVHSGVVGWPYPVGWVANTLALLRRKKLIIVIESTPWRLQGASDENWKRRVRAHVTEHLARWFTSHADLGIFTQPAYRDSLMVHGPGSAFINPASWIDERDVLSVEAANAAWDQKAPHPIRVLFAGRLVHDKGVGILLAAARELEQRGQEICIDIIGDGPAKDECAVAAGELTTVRIRQLKPVSYGEPFFSLLRRYHALIVPSLSDEQPRIVFDAYSQAVPIVASNTDGLRPHVEEGVTGWLVTRADPLALADRLQDIAREPEILRPMGLRARELATHATHRAMHERRWEILLRRFGSGA